MLPREAHFRFYILENGF